MRWFDNRNPDRDDHGQDDRKKPVERCPECGGENGRHNQVRYSEKMHTERRTPKYRVVWKPCPRAKKRK